MTKTTLLLFLTILTSINVFAQDSLKNVPKNKSRGGIFFISGNMNQFYRTNDERLQMPSNPPFWNWQAGLNFTPINLPKYRFRWQLSYTNKGAKETFNSNSTQITSEANLSYVQLSVLPLVYKPLGSRKFNPFIAVGGYGSYIIKSNYTFQVNNLPNAVDNDAIKNTRKVDYGASMGLGIYFKGVTLEYRYELGLVNLLDQRTSTSTIKNQNSIISLIFQ